LAKIQLKLIPQEGMQTEALESPADELFLGGQAGPGKSWLLLFADLPEALEYGNLRVLFLRRNSPELADLLDKAISMYKPLGAKFYTKHPLYQRSAFQFPLYDIEKDEEGNITSINPKPGKPEGAVFVFGHMDEEKTKYDYGGFEFTRINWDELPNFLESQYLFMWSRLRSAKIFNDDGSLRLELKTRMRATGNPVGIGMLWVKRRFIDPMPARCLRAFAKIGDRDIMVDVDSHPTAKTRMFIPGDRQQNKFIGQDYEGNLTMLGSRDYNALALGKWEIQDVPGQLISGKWLDHAFSGKVLPLEDATLRDRAALAFDYATDRGSDKSVLMVGPGNKVQKIRAWDYTKQDDAAYLVVREAKLWGWKDVKVAVDGNGPGVGVLEKLESGAKQVKLSLKECWNWVVDIEALPGVERCVETDKQYTDMWKIRARKNFPNFRSQMYWKLKDDLEQGRIDLSALLNEKESAEHIESLQTELLSITYEERAGMIYIVKKEDLRRPDRLGRSPDFADTLAMWNWVRERTREERKVRMPWDIDEKEETDPFVSKSAGMWA